MSNSHSLKILQQLLIKIPRGKVTTYKELAKTMGTKGYRTIGQLLHQNPEPERFPCYKVVRSDGSLGGYALGASEKIRRLKADGVEVGDGKIVVFEEKLFRF